MKALAQIAFVDEDGDIRVNFGMFAGRDATQAEIDELANALLEEVDAITIVAEQRTVADREMEASVHQIRVELDEEADPQRPLRSQSAGPRPASPSAASTPPARPPRCGAMAGRPTPQRRHRRPRRPRQDDARRRDALAVRRLPRQPGRGRARARLDGPEREKGSRSSPRTPPSATARRRSTSSTRRATPTSAARSSAD